MTKRKLKPFVVPVLYSLTVVVFVFCLYMIQLIIGKVTFKEENQDTNYVDSEIIEPNNQLPVVTNETVIIRPYTASNVSIAKDFYDYKAEADK